jgi:hypothetical protein
LQNSYRLSYLTDAQQHPDGGFPTLTSAVPAAAPALAMRKRLALNDLRDWTPNAPVLLCGGALDPVVFWLNAQLMQAYRAQVAPAAPAGLLDLESPVSAQDPYATLKQGFEVAKAAVAADAVAHGATDGGAAAVFDAYHVTLVAPFCLAAARSFIAGH